MIPRFCQRDFGRGPEFGEPVGDCLSTCVAMILRVPQDSVPNFVALGHTLGIDWRRLLNEFLLPNELCFLELPASFPGIDRVLTSMVALDAGFVLAMGKVPCGGYHCVVWNGDRLVVDPNRGSNGLSSVDSYGLFLSTRPDLVFNRAKG